MSGPGNDHRTDMIATAVVAVLLVALIAVAVWLG